MFPLFSLPYFPSGSLIAILFPYFYYCAGMFIWGLANLLALPRRKSEFHPFSWQYVWRLRCLAFYISLIPCVFLLLVTLIFFAITPALLLIALFIACLLYLCLTLWNIRQFYFMPDKIQALQYTFQYLLVQLADCSILGAYTVLLLCLSAFDFSFLLFWLVLLLSAVILIVFVRPYLVLIWKMLMFKWAGRKSTFSSKGLAKDEQLDASFDIRLQSVKRRKKSLVRPDDGEELRSKQHQSALYVRQVFFLVAIGVITQGFYSSFHYDYWLLALLYPEIIVLFYCSCLTLNRLWIKEAKQFRTVLVENQVINHD